LFFATIGGVMEAMKIWSGCSKLVPFTAKLVGTPSFMEAAPVATKISKGLALRDRLKRGVGRGQQRCIDENRPHGWKGHFVKQFMR
jgi:hypothetical protein